MNIIDKERIYIALGTDHAGQSLEQPGNSNTTDARNPTGEHALYYANHHNSSDALSDSLATARREEVTKPH